VPSTGWADGPGMLHPAKCTRLGKHRLKRRGCWGCRSDMYSGWWWLIDRGGTALAHGNGGRQPAHTVKRELQEQVVALAGGEYPGINRVHLTDLLAGCKGIVLSPSTIRWVLAEAQIGSPRIRRVPRHRSRREPYPQEGMLVQIDGSPHDWLQGRRPRPCLLAAIDDATGRVVSGVFRQAEDSAGYLALLRGIVLTSGHLLAVYHDRPMIFGSEQQGNRLEVGACRAPSRADAR